MKRCVVKCVELLPLLLSYLHLCVGFPTLSANLSVDKRACDLLACGFRWFCLAELWEPTKRCQEVTKKLNKRCVFFRNSLLDMFMGCRLNCWLQECSCYDVTWWSVTTSNIFLRLIRSFKDKTITATKSKWDSPLLLSYPWVGCLSASHGSGWIVVYLTL